MSAPCKSAATWDNFGHSKRILSILWGGPQSLLSMDKYIQNNSKVGTNITILHCTIYSLICFCHETFKDFIL